jgi:hypothetical protein
MLLNHKDIYCSRDLVVLGMVLSFGLYTSEATILIEIGIQPWN